MKLSRISLCGRLADDPQFKPTTDGDENKDRCWFRLIVNRRHSDKLDSHPVLCWGAQARACRDHLEKGKEVIVEGELHSEARRLEDANGNQLVTAENKPLFTNYYEVGANYVSFGANSKKSQEAAAQAAASAPTAVAAPVASTAPATAAPALDAATQALIESTAAALAAKMVADQKTQSVPEADPMPFVAG